MPRLFTAVGIPGPIAAQLREIQGDLPAGARLAPPELHLTLHFIGNTTAAEARAVEAGLRAVRAAPFEVRLNGLGCFPSEEQPKILWAGVEQSTPLAALRDAVGAMLAAQDIALDRREYRPHLTLARLDRSSQGDAVPVILRKHAGYRASFVVRSFALYSVGHRGRERCYRPRARFALLG